MCAYHMHVLFALLTVVTIFRCTNSYDKPLEDLERLLLGPVDHVAAASHPIGGNINLDGSWEDILHRNRLIVPQAVEAHQAPPQVPPGSHFDHVPTAFHPTSGHLDLDGSWEDILHQSSLPQAAEAHRPIAPPEVHPAQAVGAASASSPPVLDDSADRRLRMITTVKDYFYVWANTAVPNGNILYSAYQGNLDQGLFELIVTTLAAVDRKHGMYPVQIGSERYLLQQAKANMHDFRALNGFAAEERWHIWYNVFHEVGRVGTKGTFSFVGSFRGPYAQVNKPFRDRFLSPTAVKLSEIRALSGSTFEAQVQPYS